ncbi:S-layer homology domain-containing protein [Cohnella cellulosilytica]|uniref:S-layer homology domain-containing protein n=2 Tax=Cohnella cellulosilytica TaxID=986710 RepID=A0ABW2FMB1_9BACL
MPLLSVGGGQASAAASSWPLIDGNGVNGINQFTYNHANVPTIAVYKNEVYAAWVESNQSGSKTVNKIRVKKLIGAIWTSIDGDGMNYNLEKNANNPTMMVFNGKLYLAWEEMSIPYSQIKVKSYDGFGWTEVVEGNGLNITPEKEATAPALVVFDNALYAAWQEKNDADVLQIRVKKYEGNKSWTSLDQGGQKGLNRNEAISGLYPAMAVFQGSLYLTWVESNGNSGQIRVNRYDGDKNWTSVDGDSANGLNMVDYYNGNKPSMAALDDFLVVIWEEAPVRSTDSKIRAKRYNGTGWEKAEGSSTYGLNRYDGFQVREPALIAFNNELFATWQELKYGTIIYQIRVRKYDGGEWTFVDGGGNDGLNKNVGEAAIDPAIAAGNSELFVTWQEKSPEAGKYNQIRVAKYIAPAVRSVTLNLASATVVQGGIRQLLATVDAVGGANNTVTWSSSGVDQKVTVDGTGKVSVAADAVPGDYTITATSVFDAGKQGTATITVTPAPAVHSVSIDPASASVMQGESKELSASVVAVGGANNTVTWSSSGVDQKVTVDGAGKVSAAADAVPGDYTITATSVFDGSKQGTATITVTIAPAIHSVSIDPSTASVMQGESKELSASVVAAGGATPSVTWSSNGVDQKVTVDEAGKVSAAADAVPGDYTITATSVFDASKQGTATITVTAAPAIHSVSIEPSAASIMQGGSKQLSASVVAAGGADEAVTWSSEDGGGQVTVDNTGNVTAAPETIPGVYTITATSVFDASKKGTATITVTEAYSYSIAPISDQTLTPLTLGYTAGTQESRPVSIANTGTGALANLSVTLSGANASDFVVTPPDSALVGGASTSFGLAVKDGLPANTYTATVTVAADHLAPVSFVVTQAVHLPNAPANPQDLAALGGDRLATLGWSPVPNATQYRVYMAADPNPSDFAEVATVTSATYGAFNLVNGTTYYFIVKSENPGGLSAASNLVAVTPSAVPGAPTEVTAAAGKGRAVITFTPPSETGGSPITGYEVIVSPGNAVVAGGSSPITVTGLTNGVSYTFTVKAINGAGKSAASAESNAVVPTAPPADNGGSSPSQSQPSAPTAPGAADETGVDILVNGKVENAGAAKVSERGDRTVMTVAVDEKKLGDKLAAEGRHAVVTIPIGKPFDIVVAELNGRMIKNMEDKQAVLEFKTDYATYTLPANQIRIDSISAQAGSAAALQDLRVRIEIAVPTADELKVAENAAAQGRFELVARPLGFTVSAVYGEKTVEVARFDVYVERTIAIPEGIDPSKITTGVVVEPDGTVRHVPTKVRQIDGKYEAQINSLTNSLYAVVWHPLEFGDAEKHWAKEAVNDMGSRMIVDGIGNGMFAPDREITRAEFAAIVVRGLGLKPENGATPFSDVKSEDWYGSAVHTAYAHGLISGMGDGTFRPDDKVTREQAMLILSKAMAITGLKEQLPERPADGALRSFEDAAAVASWALGGVADNLQAGVVSGRAGNILAPKDYMTRAETATMIRRLLQKSDLI